VVRRGRQACLWGLDSDGGQRPSAPDHQAADRRVRGDHAVELSAGDDHPQGGPGWRWVAPSPSSRPRRRRR
jgi:hypothetical protein